MNVGSLFSGIGGLDLGLERAGMRIVWQVECDPYARAVLRKHWPDVPCYEDVREVGAANLAPVDLICGGFPCQDISNAGRMAGIDGERSGLWAEFARIIREIRPRYALVENVAALLARGLERVVGDLAACGYDAEWDCLPSFAVGAPHRRDRLFLIAYAQRAGLATDLLEQGRAFVERPEGSSFFGDQRWMHEPARQHGRWMDAAPEARIAAAAWTDAPCEPLLLGVPDGVSRRIHRLRGLGNAVVPQVAEYIGRLILAHAKGPQMTPLCPTESQDRPPKASP